MTVVLARWRGCGGAGCPLVVVLARCSGPGPGTTARGSTGAPASLCGAIILPPAKHEETVSSNHPSSEKPGLGHGAAAASGASHNKQSSANPCRLPRTSLPHALPLSSRCAVHPFYISSLLLSAASVSDCKFRLQCWPCLRPCSQALKLRRTRRQSSEAATSTCRPHEHAPDSPDP